MGMLGSQPVPGQHHAAARLGAQVRGPSPDRAGRADAVAAAVEVNHRRLRTRRPDGHHLGRYPADALLGDRGAARQQERPGELVQPRALNPPGQGRVEAAPAELPRARAHDRGRHPQRRASAPGAHAAVPRPSAGTAARSGMTRYAARSKRRTRCRYTNVWSGQLFVFRPEAVVYQLWQPVSHTDARLAF